MSQVNYNHLNKFENLETIKNDMGKLSRNLLIVQSILGLSFPAVIILLIIAAAKSKLFLGKGFEASFSLFVPLAVIAILVAHYILFFKLAGSFTNLFLYFAKKRNYMIKTAEDTARKLKGALIFEIVVNVLLLLAIASPFFLILEFLLAFIYLIVYATALNKISNFFEELSAINGCHYRKHKLLPISKIINIVTIIVLMIGLINNFIYMLLVNVWGLEGLVSRNDLIWLGLALASGIAAYICMILGFIFLNKDIQKIDDGDSSNGAMKQPPQTNYITINTDTRQITNNVSKANQVNAQINQKSETSNGVVFCSQCGHKNSKKSKFCTMCGAELN